PVESGKHASRERRKHTSCPLFPAQEPGEEPSNAAAGPQDAEVHGRFEPLGERAIVDDGSFRTAGMSERQFRRYRDRSFGASSRGKRVDQVSDTPPAPVSSPSGPVPNETR